MALASLLACASAEASGVPSTRYSLKRRLTLKSGHGQQSNALLSIQISLGDISELLDEVQLKKNRVFGMHRYEIGKKRRNVSTREGVIKKFKSNHKVAFFHLKHFRVFAVQHNFLSIFSSSPPFTPRSLDGLIFMLLSNSRLPRPRSARW